MTSLGGLKIALFQKFIKTKKERKKKNLAPGRKVAFQMLCFLFFYLYFSWWYFSRSTFSPQDITFALNICLCFLDSYIHVQLILTMQIYLHLDEWLMTLKKFGNIGHSNKTVCWKSYMAKQMQRLIEIHTYIYMCVCMCVCVCVCLYPHINVLRK